MKELIWAEVYKGCCDWYCGGEAGRIERIGGNGEEGTPPALYQLRGGVSHFRVSPCV
jgi:hypothetical protein